jgi:hypothetical protein
MINLKVRSGSWNRKGALMKIKYTPIYSMAGFYLYSCRRNIEKNSFLVPSGILAEDIHYCNPTFVSNQRIRLKI